MEKKVALAQRLRSFLDECISESSTEVTTIESIEDAWQRYCESKNESWTIMHGMTGKMEKMTMVKFDAFKQMLIDFYKYEYVESGPHRIPSWKCKVVIAQ